MALSTWLDWDYPEDPEDPGVDDYDPFGSDWIYDQREQDKLDAVPVGFPLRRPIRDAVANGASPTEIMALMTPDELARLPY